MKCPDNQAGTLDTAQKPGLATLRVTRSAMQHCNAALDLEIRYIRQRQTGANVSQGSRLISDMNTPTRAKYSKNGVFR